jgi:plastocyanin
VFGTRAFAVCVLLAVFPGFASAQNRPQNAARPEIASETITIRLSSFKFAPDHLRLRAGVPVRLHLVNESDRGHDFSAPGFFSAGLYGPGSSPPAKGRIEVGGKQSADIAIVPKQPGTYDFECTHFLHSLFGMSGTIEVVGGPGLQP